MVTSTKATGGTPAPAVTIAVRNKETGIGWKKSQIRGFVLLSRGGLILDGILTLVSSSKKFAKSLPSTFQSADSRI